MPIEIRPFTEDELPLVQHGVLTPAFGEDTSAENIEDEKTWFEYDRSLTAIEDGAFVGAAGAYSFDLTLPGQTTIPVAGVTWVAVLPTHRRRGILTSLMRRQLDDVADRGESVAVLTASEGTIYGRFGYGMANQSATFEVATRRSAMAVPPAPAGGTRLRLLSKEEAPKVLPELFDAYRRSWPGALSRSDSYWTMYFRDRESWRDGASSRLYVVHESSDGVANGYSAYRVKETHSDAAPGNTAMVMELASVDPEVDAALWRYLFDLDLVSVVQGWNRPLDDPLKWRLTDTRAYRLTKTFDWLWVRVLDVPAALAARRYVTEGSVVLEITDGFRPANDGCYRLDGGPDGAECARTSDPADLRLDVADLGSLYLGAVSPRTLARAGRVTELRPGALARADALFAPDRLPHCTTGF